MTDKKYDLQPNIEKLVHTVGTLIGTACEGVVMLERNVFDVLDTQIINRLLYQYDKLKTAGYSHNEALDSVVSLIQKRLETAISERSQDDH